MSSRLPPGPRDTAAVATLLDLAVDLAGDQSQLAKLIGVDRSTVAHYVAGRRSIELHVLLAAFERLLRIRPDMAPRVVEAVASSLLDQHGQWVPDAIDEDLGDLSDESAEVTMAQAELLRAAKAGDPEAVAQADLRLRTEARQLGLVARRAS